MANAHIEIPQAQIAEFCKRWQVREFALFGSVLRDDFRADSDVDVLVSFREDARIGLWELGDMRNELEAMLGRKVDLVEKEALRNPFRKHSTLGTSVVLYSV